MIVVLGGDGAMLRTLHRCFWRRVAVYGMHRGSVGFLMNEYRPDDLVARVGRAEPVELRPLRMIARTMAGETVEEWAVNEVSVVSRDPGDGQAAHPGGRGVPPRGVDG